MSWWHRSPPAQAPGVQERLTALQQVSAETFYETAEAIVAWSSSRQLLDLFAHSTVPRCLIVGEPNKHKTHVLPDLLPRFVIPQTGHFMLLENPAVTIDVLAQWIAEQRS